MCQEASTKIDISFQISYSDNKQNHVHILLQCDTSLIFFSINHEILFVSDWHRLQHSTIQKII